MESIQAGSRMWSKIRKTFRSFLRPPQKRSLGELGERAAAKFLRRKKYRVVDRNVRFQQGEIDIVAVDGKTIVFVEVKTRSSTLKGEPWEAVDQAKQEKILKAASIYLNREGLNGQKTRFDIVSVTWNDHERLPQIEHLEDAFDETG